MLIRVSYCLNMTVVKTYAVFSIVYPFVTSLNKGRKILLNWIHILYQEVIYDNK